LRSPFIRYVSPKPATLLRTMRAACLDLLGLRRTILAGGDLIPPWSRRLLAAPADRGAEPVRLDLRARSGHATMMLRLPGPQLRVLNAITSVRP
jgi:hypothetical protein